MLKRFLLLFLLLNVPSISSNAIEIDTHEIKEELMRVYFGVCSGVDIEFAKLIKKSLEWSGQFSLDFVKCDKPRSKKNIAELGDVYSLAIFIDSEVPSKINWRLYDVLDGDLIKGKSLARSKFTDKELACKLADQIWQELTQKNGCFSTKIAYIRRNKDTEYNSNSVICTCDYDGSNHNQLNVSPGHYIGLSWDFNSDRQRLFCSELARYNVRLISVLPSGKKQVVLNSKGTHIGISSSEDGNTAVYCRSGNIWQCQYDAGLHKIHHEKLIYNDGKNFSPTLLANGDILFCSDSKEIFAKKIKTGGPKVCYYKHSDKSIDIITKNGYCLSPAYNSLVNRVVYAKKIDGFFQLFICDLSGENNKQVTFDKISKFDPRWSPCGNHLVFCIKSKNSSRIAMLNLNTNKYVVITDDTALYSSPTWA